MRRHLVSTRSQLLLAFRASIPCASRAPTPTPTPTPRAKSARKLGGGSFGLPPATDPVRLDSRTSSLADVVRKTQDESAVSYDETAARNRDHERDPSEGGADAGRTLDQDHGNRPGRSLESRFHRLRRAAPVVGPRVPGRQRTNGGGLARARGRQVRERADRAEAEVAASQAEVRRLENDFYAWSDGNYRERVIRPAWDQAKEKLELLEAEIEKRARRLGRSRGGGRKSGTPPGWLR